ncbi:protein shisa-5-like isoform X1 [Saccostrea cucullata]|uniref:protein shisa-5-like isoform X1 n=1 Tax=Saccostrea cuccullata TaxID=36930 RepID=UPI002ED56AFA
MECLYAWTTFLFLVSAPLLVWAGECCKAHYDILLSYNKEKWCDDYCCIQLGKYDCCSNVLFQAPSSEREDLCAAYFSQHEWVAVLIGLGCIAVFVGIIICICKSCCGHSRTGVVMHGAAGPGVTVVNSNTMATHQQTGYPMPQQAGYPMPQQQGYPMQHQSGNTMQPPPSYPA